MRRAALPPLSLHSPPAAGPPRAFADAALFFAFGVYVCSVQPHLPPPVAIARTHTKQDERRECGHRYVVVVVASLPACQPACQPIVTHRHSTTMDSSATTTTNGGGHNDNEGRLSAVALDTQGPYTCPHAHTDKRGLPSIKRRVFDDVG